VDTGSKALLEANPAFSSLFGYKQEECRRLTLYDIMSGDPAECDRIIGMSLGSVNQPMPEVFCRRKNGMPMPMELAVSRIPSGRRELFCVILRDVTERRRAEEAVRTKEIVERSESRFRTMATHAPVGIFQTDVWGDCLFINETYTRLTGIGGREAVGKGWLLSIHPDDRDGVVSAWFEAVRGGNEFSLEYRFLPEGGEEVRVFANAMPVRDENGRISGYIGTITDISELKKREVELKEQSSFLNAVIQRAAEGICVCRSMTGHIYVEFTVWNDRMAEITGYSMEEINRRGWYQALYPDPEVRKKAITRMEAMRRGEDLHGEEWKIVRMDGEERVVLISTSIIKTVGEEVHVLAIIQDMTERKRMEEELVKGQKLESLGLLAGGIAHDFNNLLMGILGNISLARELIRPETEACNRLKDAEKAADRARDLSRQLLTFARGGEPVKRTVYLQETVLHGVRFALRGSNCRLACRLSDDLRPVDADEGQIGQVIGNIVLNAVQSMPSGGTLTVCTDNVDIPPGETPALSPGRYVRLSFTDQGPGIHPDHLSRVFDPYFTTKEKGSGLGLTIAYSIVKHHGGCMIAESVVGSGTTFHVYLPASESRPIGGPVRHAVTPGSRRGRILLMDDEEIVREVACQMLTHLGYTVEVCADGAEAVALYRENFERGDCFDVVIMDLTIPGGMGGKEAMTELLALDPRARGIVSSGYAAESVLARYVEYGFRGAVAKPYNMEDLDEALLRVLE
jgi:PAS domain S-box-containing protein